MDLFSKCREYTVAKKAIEEGIYPYFIPLNENEGTEVVYKRAAIDHVRLEQLPWSDNPSQSS